jgi:hypothetical protein
MGSYTHSGSGWSHSPGLGAVAVGNEALVVSEPAGARRVLKGQPAFVFVLFLVDNN